MRIAKRTAMISAAALAAALTITGCGKKQDAESQSPSPVQVQPVKPEEVKIQEEATEAQSETKAAAVKPVQKQTEPKMEDPKDVLVKTAKTDMSGAVQATISMSEGDSEIDASFQANGSAIGIQDKNGNTLYSDKDTNGYYENGTWEKIDSGYADVFSGLYNADFEKTASIDGTQCYKFTRTYDDTITSVAGMLRFSEISDYITGTVEVSYYVDPEEYKLVRVDTATDFQGMRKLEKQTSEDETEAADGSPQEETENAMGSLVVIFIPTSYDTVSLKAPVIKEKPKEDIKEEQKDTYAAGTISAENGLYQNAAFDIQIAGKDLFTYDTDKTAQMAQQYKDQKSAYTEECYAAGDGVLLNVISEKTSDDATNTLNEYLKANSSENIQAGDPVSVGNAQYETATATVTNAPIKAYVTVKNGRALVMTLFYQDASAAASFEQQLYTMADDALWVEDSWTLGQYEVKTPKGYSIDYENSGDTFTEFTSTERMVNIFQIYDTDVASETAAETASSNGMTKEIVTNEPVAMNDGNTMTYLVMKAVDQGYTYYIYEGIVQKDTDVIKYYSVSASADEDLRQTYTDFYNNTVSSVPAESEVSSEAVQDPAADAAADAAMQ